MMETLGRIHHQPAKTLHLSLYRPPPSSLKPSIRLKPFYSKTKISLRASLNPSPSPHNPFNNPPPKKTLETIASFVKPTCVALTAALFFFARLNNPAPASASSFHRHPAAHSERLPSPSKEDSEEEKERELEEYLATHHDDIQAIRALMEAKIKARKLPEAIGLVDRLIRLEPSEKDLPLLKAHLQSYGGETEAAKLGFEGVLQKDPFIVEAYHGLVMAASQSKSESAELSGIMSRIEIAMDTCKKEKRKDDLRDFKLLVAQVKVIQGEYDDALRVYQELVDEEPRDFRPYLCQGIIFTLLRKKDEAEKQFEKYRRLVPKEHPYAQYFDDNMTSMKVFSQASENKRKSAVKR